MKALLATLFFVGGIQAAPALAWSSAASPLVGRWTVDVSRLPMAPQARPKSVTITFGDAGGGRWTTRVDVVDASGATRHMEGTCALNGPAAPVTGGIEADTAAVRMPAPDVLVIGLGKGGVPASTRVYTLAADGQTMTETAVSFDAVPVMRTFHFRRIR